MASSLVSCLLRNCFDVGMEGNRPPGDSSSEEEEEAPRQHVISRGNSLIEVVVSRHSSSFSNGTNSEDGHMEDVNFTDEDNEVVERDNDPSCCDEGNATTDTTATDEEDNGEERNRRRHQQQQHHHNPLVSFLQHIGIGRDRAYDSISPSTVPPAASSSSTTAAESSTVASTASTTANVAAAIGNAASSRFNSVRQSFSAAAAPTKQISPNEKKSTQTKHTPHLHLASSFNFDNTTNKNSTNSSSPSNIIPGIPSSSIVLPGSEIQKQMSLAMKESLDHQNCSYDTEDECVICMDNFDPTNPRMPTLCGCGENKTYFHLPCLYQWVQQNRNCPTCGKRLRWEEF